MNQTEKLVLDPCCGGRMFYFNKEDERVLYCDIRNIDTHLCDGREFKVSPDMIINFADMPFEDNSFNQVVFDPPIYYETPGRANLLTCMEHFIQLVINRLNMVPYTATGEKC